MPGVMAKHLEQRQGMLFHQSRSVYMEKIMVLLFPWSEGTHTRWYFIKMVFFTHGEIIMR